MVIDYDKLGITPKERGMIIACIKRVFSRSNKALQVRSKGLSRKRGARGGRLYVCTLCKRDDLSASTIQVDHISPVVPIYTTLQDMSISLIIKRLWCDERNLQLLCTECHKNKSNLERKLRKKYRDAISRLFTQDRGWALFICD